MRAPRAWPGGRLDAQGGTSIPIRVLTFAVLGRYEASIEAGVWRVLMQLRHLQAARCETKPMPDAPELLSRDNSETHGE